MASPLGESVGTSGLDTGAADGATLAVDATAATTAAATEPQQDGGSAGDATPGSGEYKNSAWANLLDKVPTQLHSIITPELSNFDKNYEKLAQEYSPWRKLAQQGLTVEKVQNAQVLYNLANSNPQELFRRLQNELSKNNMLPNNNEEELEPDEVEPGNQQEVNPEIVAMQQQMQQMQQIFAQQQHQQQVSHYEQQITNELNALKSQHGEFNSNDVITRYLAQIQRGETPSIQKAYEEQQNFIKSFQTQQVAHPPKVLSPNGGVPGNTEQISTKTASDRVAAVKAMLAATQQ